jgi:EAL domain-containing protein (putative c-di-GMP-specific phosphodiesterase class I)
VTSGGWEKKRSDVSRSRASALDDFGTDFSSLASLQELPLTRVKLNQSLIAGIDTDHRSLTIGITRIRSSLDTA